MAETADSAGRAGLSAGVLGCGGGDCYAGEGVRIVTYGGYPPFVAGSDTSAEAALQIAPDTNRLRRLVLEAIDAGRGMTCCEVERNLGLRHQTASARIRELALKGRVVDSGERRLTASGRKAVVWRKI